MTCDLSNMTRDKGGVKVLYVEQTSHTDEIKDIYIMMFTLQTLQNYGISAKDTIERSLGNLLCWYHESGDKKYLALALQHIQAYTNMGFAIDGQNQTVRDILQEMDKTISDFYPRGIMAGKRIRLNKTQVRSMIGKWKPSRDSPMTIGELVDDIIRKVREHQTGRYIYEYHRTDISSEAGTEIYELVINDGESYFHDVKRFRFYTFMEEIKE